MTRAAPPSIRYRIRLADPHAHEFEVRVEVDQPDPAGQCFALPAWIPGSYLVRDFARHLGTVQARCGTRCVPIEKIDKHTWRAAPARGTLKLSYRVYAWDLSVRGAHFDATHAFFNGSSVFLRVHGREHNACRVLLDAPSGAAFSHWRVATTLPRDGAREWGFGAYRASGYDELIDHPVEMGDFDLVSFDVLGVPHHVVLTGRHDCDHERLARDLAAVCAAQVRLFEPGTARAPFDRYLFLTTAVGEGYGGLEHRASTALLCARADLPHAGMTGVPDGYRSFLGLASHEYFHSWNVKRIRPAAFARYDLDRENYTRLLWVFEGFTSYYDDLMLVRSGVIEREAYLRALERTIGQVVRGPGRLEQSVADSSFDAWIKYYRQDENSPNAIVSYYTKGALIALCMDLTIRTQTRGKRSLDDVMRAMWRRWGRDAAGAGLAENGVADVVRDATGVDLTREIAQWAEAPGELPLAELLDDAGVLLTLSGADGASPWLGVRLTTRAGDLTVGTVLRNGPAHAAGLAAGDVIIAAEGLRMNEKSLSGLLARKLAGERLRIHAFRRDELMSFDVRLAAAPDTEPRLAFVAKPSAALQRRQAAWLGKTRRHSHG